MFLTSPSKMIPMIVLSLEVIAFLTAAALTLFWIANPQGSYEPWIVACGLIGAAIDLRRRHGDRIRNRPTEVNSSLAHALHDYEQRTPLHELKIPDNYSPITAEQLITQLKDTNITELQRTSIQKSHLRKTVHWDGIVREVQSLWQHDHNSDLLVLVTPKTQVNMIDRDFISITFDASKRDVLEKLTPGDLIEFQGELRFSDMSPMPRISKGKLVRYSKVIGEKNLVPSK